MNERHEKLKRWGQRGQYAVEVEVDVVYPADRPNEACLEPDTVRWLDEMARRAGRAFQSVYSYFTDHSRPRPYGRHRRR